MANSLLATSDTLKSKKDRLDIRRTVQVTLLPGFPQITVDTMPFPLTFGEGDVQQFNKDFVRILDKLRLDVQKRGIDLSNYAHDYLAQLRDKGKAAYNFLLPEAARDYLANMEKQERNRGGIRLTFNTLPTYAFFWEMLYDGAPFNAEPEKFWGFRYPLGRAFWGISYPEHIPLQAGVFSAIHDKLQCSQQEIEQLKQVVAELSNISGLHIGLCLLDSLIRADTITIKQIIELFHDDEFHYGVVHFACHCGNAGGTGVFQPYLSFTAHEKEMDLSLEKLLIWQEYGFAHRPLVFLNACESAQLGQLMQMLSLPMGILNFGAGGVIAAACTIPDNFASAFATEFYRRLLARPSPRPQSSIGEVLLETRLHFLTEYNNPLGLAYGLYSISNQQLQFAD